MSIAGHCPTRRGMLLMGAGAAGSFALTACGAGGAASTAGTSAEAPREQVEIATYVLNDVRDTHMENMLKAGEKAAGVQLTRSAVPATAADFAEKFTAQAASGTAPDVVIMGEPDVKGWAAFGYLLSLDPFIARDKMNTNDLAGLPAWQWKAKQYALPFQSPGETWFFNRRLVDEAGLKLPSPNWTFEDVADLARKLTKGDGPTKLWGILNTNGVIPYGLASMILHNGGKVLNETRDRALWGEDPKAIEAAEFDVSLRALGVTPRPGEVVPPLQFEGGRVAMAPNGFHLAARYLTALGKDLWFVRPPRGKAPTYFAYLDTNAWSIAIGTRVRDAAWRVVKALVGDEVDRLWAPAGTPASKKAAMSQDYLKLFPGLEKQVQDLVDAWARNGRDRFITPDARKWWAKTNEELGPMYAGTRGVRDAMRVSADAVNQIFDQFPPQFR